MVDYYIFKTLFKLKEYDMSENCLENNKNEYFVSIGSKMHLMFSINPERTHFIVNFDNCNGGYYPIYHEVNTIKNFDIFTNEYRKLNPAAKLIDIIELYMTFLYNREIESKNSIITNYRNTYGTYEKQTPTVYNI